MKITLSKSQWKKIGKETGWIKQSQFTEKMMPGQTPYTPEEKLLRNKMVGNAAKAEEVLTQEELEDSTKPSVSNPSNPSNRRTDQHGQRIGLSERYILRRKRHGMEDPYFLQGGSLHSPELCFLPQDAVKVEGSILVDMAYDWTKDWAAVRARSY